MTIQENQDASHDQFSKQKVIREKKRKKKKQLNHIEQEQSRTVDQSSM